MKERHFLIAFEESWGKGSRYCDTIVINAIDQYTAIQNVWHCKPKYASWRILAISELPENCVNLPLYKLRER